MNMMNVDEIKLRLHRFLNNTIDLYLPPVGFFDKMKNSTAKLWVDQNMWKLDSILDQFADQNHYIDVQKVKTMYENVLFENDELRLDVHELLPEGMDNVK
jgi:hypothetical protein